MAFDKNTNDACKNIKLAKVGLLWRIEMRKKGICLAHVTFVLRFLRGSLSRGCLRRKENILTSLEAELR